MGSSSLLSYKGKQFTLRWSSPALNHLWRSDSFSPGCGLGMAIVRDLVVRMNGNISIDTILGHGTQVTGQSSPHRLTIINY